MLRRFYCERRVLLEYDAASVWTVDILSRNDAATVLLVLSAFILPSFSSLHEIKLNLIMVMPVSC